MNQSFWTRQFFSSFRTYSIRLADYRGDLPSILTQIIHCLIDNLTINCVSDRRTYAGQMMLAGRYAGTRISTGYPVDPAAG